MEKEGKIWDAIYEVLKDFDAVSGYASEIATLCTIELVKICDLKKQSDSKCVAKKYNIHKYQGYGFENDSNGINVKFQFILDEKVDPNKIEEAEQYLIKLFELQYHGKGKVRKSIGDT